MVHFGLGPRKRSALRFIALATGPAGLEGRDSPDSDISSPSFTPQYHTAVKAWHTSTEPLSEPEQAIADQLVEAYRHGAFPMADLQTGRIGFYESDRRGVFELGAFTPRPDPARRSVVVPRTLRQRVRQQRFEITTNTAFGQVVAACAAPSRPMGWISPELITWYDILHRGGHAHSVEAWRHDADGARTLVGGLFGVHVNGLFAGESMFSRPELGGTDASKVCLVHLAHTLHQHGFRLLDAQLNSPHLERLGCRTIGRAAYRRRLADAMHAAARWPGPGPLPAPPL